MKRIRLIIAGLLIFLTGAACSSEVEIPVPISIDAPTRVMRLETVAVKVKGMKDGTPFSVDFGEGTIKEGVTPDAVFHMYEEGNRDYDVTVNAGSMQLNKTIRVYRLLALSQAQKELKEPGCMKIWVMGHRANTSDFTIPENSIPSIDASIACGAEAIEIDTQRTADGEIVVCHDQTIDRTTTGSGDITKMTLAEIKSYCLKDRNGLATSEKMPTLEEMLKAARGKLYVDIDYSPRTASTEDVMRIVEKLDMFEQVWFYCNSVEKCREVLQINPKAHAYTYANGYELLKDLEGEYFVQAKSTPDGNNVSVADAVRDGMLVSVLMLSGDGYPAGEVRPEHLDRLLENYPECRMIMTDCSDKLTEALSARGRR